METTNIANIIDRRILRISRVFSREADQNEYEQMESLAVTTETGLIQILNDGNDISFSNVQEVSDITLIGSAAADSMGIVLQTLADIPNNSPVKYIYNFRRANYLFGTKLLDASNSFIAGLCYGFDEIILLNSTEFESMLSLYREDTAAEILTIE